MPREAERKFLIAGAEEGGLCKRPLGYLPRDLHTHQAKISKRDDETTKKKKGRERKKN